MIHVKAGENTGGRNAIHRLLSAYNFKSRQQLCDHLGASKSTMANRYLRDSFPAEWIIQCALETGVSLYWLTTGEGDSGINLKEKAEPLNNQKSELNSKNEHSSIKLKTYELSAGSLIELPFTIIDQSLSPQHTKAPFLVHASSKSYLLEEAIENLSNGIFLVSIDGVNSIVKITRLPKNRLIVDLSDTPFECDLDDIEVKGRAVKVLENL